MPISLRQWWVKRVNKAVEEYNKAQEEAAK